MTSIKNNDPSGKHPPGPDHSSDQSERARKPGLIGLGANLDSTIGPPVRTLYAALEAVAERGIKVADVSHFYRTPAWPDPGDPPFVNAVARIETRLEPTELLDVLHGVERLFGRLRPAKNAPRTLDLDLLDYDGLVEIGPPVLPHPRMTERAFVLVPLADVAPDWRHPVSDRTVGDLIAALPGDALAAVKRVSA
jgi:2-amino-4-hydroxy-6-hydroxymethyldihydropteridine diphosphokinase